MRTLTTSCSYTGMDVMAEHYQHTKIHCPKSAAIKLSFTAHDMTAKELYVNRMLLYLLC